MTPYLNQVSGKVCVLALIFALLSTIASSILVGATINAYDSQPIPHSINTVEWWAKTMVFTSAVLWVLFIFTPWG